MKRHPIITVGVIVLLLALLAACGQVPIAAPETGHPAPVEAPAPPVAEQPAVPVKPLSGSAFYAANPELMAAGRYAAAVPVKPPSGSAV